jgi:SMP-30/Gluconolactonase/LRE-like region
MDMNGMRTLLTGRGLLESPRWRGDRLYFSDWSAGEVVAVDLAGRSEVIAEVASLPLCTPWLPDGRLVIVFSPDGRLLRLEPGGSLVTHADLGQPGWNDIVADGHGHIYVNRAGFNPVAGEAFQPGSVYRASADGPARQVTDDIAFPNGMAVTADNSTLIVADSYWRQLVGFAIAADGGLSHRRVWADLGEGTPDGICADAQAPCGTPTCRTGGACGSPRAALCWAPWTWTAAALPAPSAAPAGPRPRPDHAVQHRRRMAGHDRDRYGHGRQRPGPHHRSQRARGRLAVTLAGGWPGTPWTTYAPVRPQRPPRPAGQRRARSGSRSHRCPRRVLTATCHTSNGLDRQLIAKRGRLADRAAQIPAVLDDLEDHAGQPASRS